MRGHLLSAEETRHRFAPFVAGADICKVYDAIIITSTLLPIWNVASYSLEVNDELNDVLMSFIILVYFSVNEMELKWYLLNEFLS